MYSFMVIFYIFVWRTLSRAEEVLQKFQVALNIYIYIDRKSNLVGTLKRSFFDFLYIVSLNVKKHYIEVLKEMDTLKK